MKYTKGKWLTVEHKNGEIDIVSQLTDTMQSPSIATILPVTNLLAKLGGGTTEANANLITASPELLDCLQDAMTDLIEYMSPGQRHHFRKVIKRAKGEL